MAKVPFSKLGLKVNQDIKTIEYNGYTIEIKQYLSIADKLDLISDIINMSHDSESNFSNPARVKIFTLLEIIYAYTNIVFTDKQKEDVVKTYDTLVSSGFAKVIIDNIPAEDIIDIENTTNTSIREIYAYQNSILGILDTIKKDYSDLNLDANAIQSQISDPETLGLLKDIMTKLG